jgi:hypothetical protein
MWWRVIRAAVMINLGKAGKYVRARRDITPRRRQIERAASVEMYVSAPVSKACFRPAAAEQLPTLATTTLQLAGITWPSEGIARYLDEFQEAVLI